jgi:hypothetical protein
MRLIYHHFRILPLCALAVATALFLSCGEDKPAEPEAEAPQIPPVSTFLMNFDDFPSGGKTSGGNIDPSAKLLSRDNHNWAALHVGVWNLIITVGLAVPSATFVESFAHQPQQQPDGSWKWAYDVTVSGDLYSAALYGSISNFGTQWEMYISKQGEFADFMWYSGEADLFLTEGTWTLNKHPEEPIPFVGIEWHRNIADSTADIKYTNIEPGGAENGGYIFYGVTTDTTYDAFYDIYNKSADNLIDIEWNLTGKDGRVKDPVHFQDEEWHCWDGEWQDIECP